MWSDSCSGQNKNFKMMCVWLHMVESGMLDEVIHKFFVPGHSMMDSDRDFGLIEKRKRATQYVYTHHDWINLIQSARVRNPFRVVEMATEDMRDLSEIERRFVKKKKCDDGSTLMMRTLSVVRVAKEHPGKLFLKTNYSRDIDLWSSISIGRRARKGAAPLPPPNINTLPAKYPRGRAIKAAKKADLLKLLVYIPPVHHQYFTDIVGEGDEEEDEYLVSQDLSGDEDW